MAVSRFDSRGRLQLCRRPDAPCPHTHWPCAEVRKHSPRPVPAPTHAFTPPGTYGASCNTLTSPSGQAVKPKPMATKSLISTARFTIDPKFTSICSLAFAPQLVGPCSASSGPQLLFSCSTGPQIATQHPCTIGPL